MSPSIYVCTLERLKRPNAGALRLTDCYTDRMVEYLVVTMHQVRLSLKLRLLPRSFFICQPLPYLIRSFQEIVSNNSIIPNQVPPFSICDTALLRFEPRATLACTLVEACGTIYAFTKLRVPKSSISYRNYAL